MVRDSQGGCINAKDPLIIGVNVTEGVLKKPGVRIDTSLIAKN